MEFIDYVPTPGDEKQLGIATITYNGPIVLRYRLVPNKNGGNFLCPASSKAGEGWVSAFEIDSKTVSLQAEKLIRDNIKGVSYASTPMPLNATNSGTDSCYPPKMENPAPFKEEQLPF